MKKTNFVFFAILFAAVLAFASFATNSALAQYVLKNSQKNFIIAKINNKIITNSELTDRYNFVIAASKIKITDASDKKLLLTQILDKMIDEELIRQEAATLKIEVNAQEIEETLEILAANQKKNSAQLKIFFLNNKKELFS